MKILYLANVTEPQTQAGKKGQIKDVPQHIANILIKGDYAIDKELKNDSKSINKGRDIRGKRPKN